MPNANVIELEACFEDVLRYCESHADLDFVKYYYPRLVNAWKTYNTAMKESDSKFVEWRHEEEEDRLMWKHLAVELAATQRRLRSLNAVGYPDTKIRYWDEGALAAAVNDMLAYLQERKASIEGSAEMIEKLKQKLSRASAEARDESSVFRQYQRFASNRADALGSLSAHLWDFRGAMRRQLGKTSADYAAIRWPFSLNPDDGVL